MRFHARFFVGLAVVAMAATPALSTVSLNISDNDGTPTSTSAPQGTNFNFTVRLTATSEQTQGVDYYLNTPNGSGFFSIFDRNTAGGMYNDPLFFTDATVEASPSNILNPRNDHDLGGLATNMLNAGTHLVAQYTISVSPSTPDGFYTIQTTSNPGEGWVDATSTDQPFNSHGSFTVFVPEPSALALVGLALTGLIRRRRA